MMLQTLSKTHVMWRPALSTCPPLCPPLSFVLIQLIKLELLTRMNAALRCFKSYSVDREAGVGYWSGLHVLPLFDLHTSIKQVQMPPPAHHHHHSSCHVLLMDLFTQSRAWNGTRSVTKPLTESTHYSTHTQTVITTSPTPCQNLFGLLSLHSAKGKIVWLHLCLWQLLAHSDGSRAK